MNTPCRFWSPVVPNLSPYVPGEQPSIAGLIKLNTNENPYPPSKQVEQAIREALGPGGQHLARYPDPTCQALCESAAKLWGLDPSEVFAGNGSDEVLAFCFQGLLDHRDLGPLLFPDISYSFYPSYCQLFGISFQTVALDDNFQLSLEAISEVCDGPSGAGSVIFPNPNAPTGMALNQSQIKWFLDRHPQILVVVDEAYVDFGAESCVPLVRDHANLLITQSLSKSRALAGLRVGLAFGQPPLIEALRRVKDSFNSYPLDRLALAAGQAALEDADWFSENQRKIKAERARMTQRLERLGFRVLPSLANFLFCQHPTAQGADLLDALRERKILVRHFKKARIEQFLRITVGTPEQGDALHRALEDILR